MLVKESEYTLWKLGIDASPTKLSMLQSGLVATLTETLAL